MGRQNDDSGLYSRGSGLCELSSLCLAEEVLTMALDCPGNFNVVAIRQYVLRCSTGWAKPVALLFLMVLY